MAGMNAQSSYIDTVRAWAVERHLPQAAVERWLQLGETDALAILSVAQELHLRTGQLLNALELLDEIGVREAAGAAAILARDDLRRVVRGGGSRPHRASCLIEKLREIRYPRLSHARTTMENAIAAMRLPRGLDVVLPKDLGSDELMVRLTARSGAEFERLLKTLLAKREQIQSLIETLGGSDEI
jgi:hypothetical protein